MSLSDIIEFRGLRELLDFLRDLAQELCPQCRQALKTAHKMDCSWYDRTTAFLRVSAALNSTHAGVSQSFCPRVFGMGGRRGRARRQRMARSYALTFVLEKTEPDDGEWALRPENIALIEKGIQSALHESLTDLETLFSELGVSDRPIATQAPTG